MGDRVGAAHGSGTLHVVPRGSRGVVVTATSATTATKDYQKVLVPGAINPAVEAMEYAVRGQLVIKAEEYAKRLKTQKHARRAPPMDDASTTNGQQQQQEAKEEEQRRPGSLPFDHITYCNIGNPQSLGQQPITFMRQVLAAVVCPDLLLGNPAVAALLPSDVVARAKEILQSSHGVGAYSESRGIPIIREHIAEALRKRDDGAPADPAKIFLSNGASEAVKTVLSLLIRSKNDGVLIPIPQYPLYSATLQALNGHQVPYYLDESNLWSLSVDELETRLAEATAEGYTVRALCVINPGNPTGQSLSYDNIVDIVQFCERHRLVLMADEVYQRNIYDGTKFVSFKKVVHAIQSPVELASFHSVSKGITGECGLRGGYVELHNFDEHAVSVLYKMASVSLCANIPGQIAVDLMMRPPVPGDPSYDLYQRESQGIFESLRRKGLKLAEALNKFDGVHCNPPQGALYLFPQITMPPGAHRRATELKLKSPDILYCLELLEETGICVVPGSGFGQRLGTFHFRTTFLPPEDQIDGVVVKMRSFHSHFLEKYSS
jgi:aspartate/methionine/tyrosine aminotransferase